MASFLDSIVTAEQWRLAEDAVSAAYAHLSCAHPHLLTVDGRAANEVKSLLDNCKVDLDDLESKSPVTVCDGDFIRVAELIKTAAEDDEVLTVSVMSADGKPYELIAERDLWLGWTFRLKDGYGKGNHILDNAEGLCELAGVTWAEADCA